MQLQMWTETDFRRVSWNVRPDAIYNNETKVEPHTV